MGRVLTVPKRTLHVTRKPDVGQPLDAGGRLDRGGCQIPVGRILGAVKDAVNDLRRRAREGKTPEMPIWRGFPGNLRRSAASAMVASMPANLHNGTELPRLDSQEGM